MTRISTLTIHQTALDAMLRQQASLSRTQEQISMGKKILRPSDDPAGAARILNFNRAIETQYQYQENADRLRSRLELEDSILRGLSDIVPRVSELTIQGSSDTYSAEQRSSLALEIRELLDHTLDLANTRDANGEYLFSGFQGRVKPFELVAGNYVYNGDMGQREIRISNDRTVADSDSGFAVFMDVPTSGGGTRSIFDTFDQIATTLEADGNPSAFIDDLTQILSSIGEKQASVGARELAVDEQKAINEDFILALEINRSAVEDLDYAEAISRFEREQISLQAAQQTFAKVQDLLLFNYL